MGGDAVDHPDPVMGGRGSASGSGSSRASMAEAAGPAPQRSSMAEAAAAEGEDRFSFSDGGGSWSSSASASAATDKNIGADAEQPPLPRDSAANSAIPPTTFDPFLEHTRQQQEDQKTDLQLQLARLKAELINQVDDSVRKSRLDSHNELFELRQALDKKLTDASKKQALLQTSQMELRLAEAERRFQRELDAQNTFRSARAKAEVEALVADLKQEVEHLQQCRGAKSVPPKSISCENYSFRSDLVSSGGGWVTHFEFTKG